jgi:alanine racemase
VTAFRPTAAEIDLDAIRHNVRRMKPDGAELMAVVKADGYGHGAVPVARAALDAGASWLGVALVEEGIELRDAGLDGPVLLLSEPPPGSEKDALAAGLTPTVYSERALRAVAGAGESLGRRAAVHVKVDTGMHRIGVHPPDETTAFCRQVVEAGCELDGLWTHFARAEEDEPTTRRQLALFEEALASLRAEGIAPHMVHAANSAATILYPETHFDMVRVGIALYGLDPGAGLSERAGLRPALAWRSRVAAVRRLDAGAAVSYGHLYRVEAPSIMATVPVGYADGYPRVLRTRSDVLIGGRRRRVAGVTMDQLLVDCGFVEVAFGDEVVLIGAQGNDQVGADELAELCDTLGYEIVCGISERVPRSYSP